MENKKTLSYSKLMLYTKCPYQYYFKYIIKDPIEEVVWPGGLFGTTVHSILESYINLLNDGRTHSQAEKELKGSFEKYFQLERKALKNPKVFKESREFRSSKQEFFESGNQAILSVIKFLNKYFIYDQIESEKEYKSDWNEYIDTTGIIDVKLTHKDIISIVDLKITSDGCNFWWVNWENDPQSQMYDFLIYKNFNVIPFSFSYLVYDRVLKMLFLKQRNVSSKNIEDIKNGFLGQTIDSISNFIDLSLIDSSYPEQLANPKELTCQWCSYKNKCSKKWEDPRISKVKKVLKK